MRSFQTMVTMRDGVRLNTFVFLPPEGGPRFPVILHRTPYGIAAADARDKFDCSAGLAADPGRADARLDPARLARDRRARLRRRVPGLPRPPRLRGRGPRLCRRRGRRARHAGVDRGAALVQPAGRHVRLVGRRDDDLRRRLARGIRACARSSRRPAAPASTTTSSTRASRSRWSGCGCGWRSNIPGLSASHRAAVMRQLRPQRGRARARRRPRLARATPGSTRRARPSRRSSASPDWMRLPLLGYPDFATWQPFLDEIITPSGAGRVSRAATISGARSTYPGFHVTSWFDIFQTSVIAAFQDIQARTGTQKLWIGPNEHYFVYADEFLAARPVFRMVRLLAEGRADRLIMDQPPCSIRRAPGSKTAPATSPTTGVMPSAGRRRACAPQRLYLRGDGTLVQRRVRTAPRAPTPTIRAGRSRRSAGATC